MMRYLLSAAVLATILPVHAQSPPRRRTCR